MEHYKRSVTCVNNYDTLTVPRKQYEIVAGEAARGQFRKYMEDHSENDLLIMQTM
jgi:hypothetical protein